MVVPSHIGSPPQPLVIACMCDHPKALMLLRAARKRAQELGARWIALYVETPEQAIHADDGAQERMLHMLTLASQMGGEAVHLEAQTLEAGLTKQLEETQQHLKLCMVGSIESDRSVRLSPSKEMVRIAEQYSKVEIVPLTGQLFIRSAWLKPHMPRVRLAHLAYALGAVAIAFACAALLQWILPPALFRINEQNIALLFMIACAFVAGRYGLIPGLLASVAGFLIVNYYFVPPHYTVRINSITDMLNASLFLSAAVLISLFTSQTRSYAQKSRTA